MANYKDYSYEQDKLVALSFSKQIQPGSFEYTLHTLNEEELDLSCFDSKRKEKKKKKKQKKRGQV